MSTKSVRNFSYLFTFESNFDKDGDNIPERMVISPRASIAPVNTVTLGFLIARMAAMKNVLSPSSDTIITDSEARNA